MIIFRFPLIFNPSNWKSIVSQVKTIFRWFSRHPTYKWITHPLCNMYIDWRRCATHRAVLSSHFSFLVPIHFLLLRSSILNVAARTKSFLVGKKRAHQIACMCMCATTILKNRQIFQEGIYRIDSFSHNVLLRNRFFSSIPFDSFCLSISRTFFFSRMTRARSHTHSHAQTNKTKQKQKKTTTTVTAAANSNKSNAQPERRDRFTFSNFLLHTFEMVHTEAHSNE